MTGICFQCGKRLVDARGHDIEPVVRDYHGNPVKLHKTCARGLDHDDITARAATDEAGHVYADDKLYTDGFGKVVRVVYAHAGETD